MAGTVKDMVIVTPSGRRARIIGWHPDEGVVTVRSIAADESGIASTGVMHVHVVPPFNMLSVPGVARAIQRKRAYEESHQRRRSS
jgi:hypothetical protein